MYSTTLEIGTSGWTTVPVPDKNYQTGCKIIPIHRNVNQLMMILSMECYDIFYLKLSLIR